MIESLADIGNYFLPDIRKVVADTGKRVQQGAIMACSLAHALMFSESQE